LYRLAARKVSGFIAVSEEVRLSILNQVGAIDGKIFTISNGVDTSEFERPGNKQALCKELGLEQDAHLAVLVGRLHEQKGHRYLIEAVPTIIDRFPKTHFLLIGEGELRASLEKQVDELGLKPHVIFMGIRHDVPDILAAVDLFLLPSLWEGLSIALLEAMAAAKPIVASAVSGTNQVMISGETGLLVPPGSSQALAEAILQVLADPVRARRMGSAARQHVIKNFSAQKQAKEHLNLYRRLLTE
jgi:glycosyltransferase involved in cell wall biosynthesis